MKKIVMMRGLPASGKSTYAKDLVKNDKYKRLNKDDLRAMIDCSEWSRENEELVVKCRNMMLAEFMRTGKNIVIDDTNFEQKHWEAIKQVVQLHNIYAEKESDKYVMEDKFIDTDVEECIKRDALRASSVGAKVIRDMHERYLKPAPEKYELIEGLPSVVICDLDGTLALLNGRNPYDASRCEEDSLNYPVAHILKCVHQTGLGAKVIFLSGREDKFREQTERFLDKNGFFKSFYTKLLMRKTGDNRKDAIIKREVFDEEILGKYNVLCVLDDRKQVVDMWRNLGLTCLQVAEGNF